MQSFSKLAAVVSGLIVLSVFPQTVRGQENPDVKKTHVVMLVAEREYETIKTLPVFVKKHLSDYRVTMVLADPNDTNVLEGIEAVADADVLLVSVRRRALPKGQLDRIRKHVADGKPVIGIRTANHAFSLRNKPAPEGRAVWPKWDQEVFGGNYTNHYGNSLKATVSRTKNPADESQARTLLKGVPDKPFVAGGSLYKVAPLAKTAQPLMVGRVEGHPAEPVAWTFRRSDGGKSFYTSLGHVDDFRGEVLPTLLANAIAWATK